MAKKSETEPAMIRRFPGTLFVRREQDLDDEYFNASPLIEGEDGELIGIYHLTEVKCKRISTTLEPVE